MLPAVVCFVSVLCTASLASFGMDAAASITLNTKKTVMTSADEDVVRMVTDDESSVEVCLMFHELFAAVAILVSIVYYAVVKLTLMGMGAVIMAPPNPHPLYHSDDDEFCESSDEEKKSDGTFSVSSSSASDQSMQEEVVVYDASAVDNNNTDEMALVVHTAAEQKASSSFPASDEIEVEEEEEEVPPSPSPPTANKEKRHHHHHLPQRSEKKGEGERFNSVKIWTNVYGLSIGIYCLVYSLLLPNELSAFVFCIVSLLAGVHEALTPCLQMILAEEEYEMVGETNRKRKVKNWHRQAKRCLGWLCLFQSSVASEIKEAASRSRAGARRAVIKMMRRASKRQPKKVSEETNESRLTCSCRGQIGSGILVMPCIFVALGLGLASKVRRKLEHCGSYVIFVTCKLF